MNGSLVSGNGLALKVIGETIRELFGGEIGEYLADIPASQSAMIGGIRHLLRTQIERLSDAGRQVLRVLAARRESVSLAALTTDASLCLKTRRDSAALLSDIGWFGV